MGKILLWARYCPAQDITLRNNTIHASHGPWLQISDEENQYPDASFGYCLENNLTSGSLWGLYLWNFGQSPFPEERTLQLLDNTIETKPQQDVWCLP
ncbi:hypothetical protein ACFLZW_06565 [Chloroflexota bacterium]